MILIADSGSTKTNWFAIDSNGNELFKVTTKGLNPAVFSEQILTDRIVDSSDLMDAKNTVTTIHFYGAGCGTSSPKAILLQVLQSIFTSANITIKEDTVAAVNSVTTEPAIVCILGTGSNCSYFDGSVTHQKIISLGYSVMDDASGNYYGRILLRDYYFNKMPAGFATDFAANHNLDADEIKKNLYKKENPNTYLANFSHYLVKHKDSEYAQNIILTGIRLFIENQILQFNESKTLPIHFIGSLAFFLQDEIRFLFKEYNLELGKIERHPINGLVNYHIKAK